MSANNLRSPSAYISVLPNTNGLIVQFMDINKRPIKRMHLYLHGEMESNFNHRS
jgi:hypothetical protein